MLPFLPTVPISTLLLLPLQALCQSFNLILSTQWSSELNCSLISLCVGFMSLPRLGCVVVTKKPQTPVALTH